MFKPESTTRARDDNRVEVTVAPRWVRPDGRSWEAIDLFTTVTGHRFHVQPVGSKLWAAWQATTKTANVLDRATKRHAVGRHFGQVLDVAELDGVDDLEFQVTAHPQATRLSNGDILLAVIDGVRIGLCLSDLRAMGLRETSNGKHALDIRAAKAAARTDGTGEIDLDPTSLLDDVTNDWGTYRVSTATWTTSREANSGATVLTSSFETRTGASNPFVFYRPCCFFDVGATAAATDILLTCQYHSGASGDISSVACLTSKPNPGVDDKVLQYPVSTYTGGNYRSAFDALGTDGDLGVFTAIGGDFGTITVPDARWQSQWMPFVFMEATEYWNLFVNASNTRMVMPGVTNREPKLTYTAVTETILDYERAVRGVGRGTMRGAA